MTENDQEDPASKMSKLSFNPGANTFVPNFGASEFVPFQMVDTEEAPAEPAKKAVVVSLGAAKSEPKKASNPEVKSEVKSEAKSEQKSEPKTEIKVEAKKELTAEEKAIEDEFYQGEKQHLNIVFIGHVDAGKSTMGGHILFLTGMVDKRTLEKFEKEAKEQNRESWYLSWALDVDDKERAKGKTVEVGKAYFETDKKQFTILDAPGHKNYVPSMIAGASQADIGILVISARKGEFETGFEKGGQTREHAMIAKTAGVKKMVVAINKMDDPTVNWEQARYDECVGKLTPFLKQCGYNPKTELEFVPISGFTGANLKATVSKEVCPWFSGSSLLDLLDNLDDLGRENEGQFIMPVSEKFKDMGSTFVAGKIESGRIRKTKSLLMMPTKKVVEVTGVFNEQDDEMKSASCGDNIRMRLRNIEEEDIQPGYVLCDPSTPVNVVSSFEATLMIMDSKNIICSGYSCVMHVHSCVEEIIIGEFLYLIDKKTNRRSKKPPVFVKKGHLVCARIELPKPTCLETYEMYQQLGRFTLRSETTTIAMGKITKLIHDDDAGVATE